MICTGTTEPGSAGKQNEDWYASAPGLLVVADGATVRTDTGCVHGVPWYTAHLGAELISADDPDNDLRDVLAAAIAHVAKQHPGCNLTHPGTPSAAVGIVRMARGKLRWLVLGDVTLVIETVNGVQVHSDPRVSQTAAAERAEADRWPIGSAEKAAALIPMKHAELAARNMPGGYWIAAADPKAARHAVTGDIPLDQVRRVVLLTDGAARVVDMFNLLTWDELPGWVSAHGAERLIRKVRAAEQADELGETHPRNKVSDDATVLMASADLVPHERPDLMGDVFQVGAMPEALMGDSELPNPHWWKKHRIPEWPHDLVAR